MVPGKRLAVKLPRYHFDRLIMWYLGITFAILFAGVFLGIVFVLASVAQMFMLLMLVRITSEEQRFHRKDLLRWLYPLILIVPLYYEIGLLGFVFNQGDIYDPLVQGWDLWLFDKHPHKILPDLLAGSFWREFLHFIYFTYYLLIVAAFYYVWKRSTFHKPSRSIGEMDHRMLRFNFVFMGAFLTYMVIFIWWPVTGPTDDRFLRYDGVGGMSQIIDWIYQVGESGFGAMPSSHIGESIVIYLLLGNQFSRRLRAMFMVWFVLLCISTVYTQFHYAIDTITGIPIGIGFYYFWDWLYRRQSPEGHRAAARLSDE